MKVFLIALALMATSALAMSVDEIVKKTHLTSYYQADNGKAQILMKVYSKGGGKAIKKLFYMLRLDKSEGGEQSFFIYFVKPTDIKRTTFLVHKKIQEDDFRRLYIPASDKILAIAGSRKQDPFMGSDFSYEDVSGRHYTKDSHKLLGSAKIGSADVYMTESIPKSDDDKILKINAWIDKKTFIPLKVEYYNRKGQLFRVYSSDKIQKIKGHNTITKRTMRSPLDGTHTIMLVNPKKVEFDIKMDKSLFSERSLKNPPMNLLK